MQRTSDWDRVYVDTSAFIYFDKAGPGLCMAFSNYLGEKLRISTDVETELGRSHRATVKFLMLVKNWPPGGAQELPPHLTDEARRIIELSHEEGDPKDKNAGEVTTVMCAQQDGKAMVVLEDKLGKKQARDRGVKRLSTAQLAAEMAAVGVLTEEQGYAVFRQCIEGVEQKPEQQVKGWWESTLRDAQAASKRQ
jgi:hypothetical protein